jgi:dTDP-4-amino-4,6-dideoxygalactose transaminase
MTDIQAALGISQLKRLKQFVEQRHTIATQYDELLADLPVRLQLREAAYSGMHLYVIRLITGQIKKTHRQVFEAMREAGIGVNLHYIPVHLQPYYQAMGFKLGDYPEAECYYHDAITLPMFPALTEIEVKQVVTTLREIIT